MIKKPTILIWAGALAVVAMAQDTAVIEWKPKVGETTKYRIAVNANMDAGMGPMDITFTSIMTERILKIEDNKNVTVESTQSDFGLYVGGQDMSSMMSGQVIKALTVMKPNGEVVKRSSEGGNEMENPRMEEMMVTLYPDKPLRLGDSWTREVKGDTSKGTVDAEATYKYEGKEKIGDWDCYKISYTYNEKRGRAPMSAKGTIYIAVENGTMVQSDMSVQNVEFQPGLPPANAVFKVTRIKS